MKRGGGRPTRGYRLKDGTRVPSVTTITGRFKDAGGLVGWAYKLGLEGKDMDKEREGAANAGTLGHALIEGEITGSEPYLASAHEMKMTEAEYEKALSLARTSFGGFKNWRKAVDLEVIAVEVPLVSESHRFGGTIDGVGRVCGELAIIDWKTSKRVYAEYITQVSAYARLWEEHHPADVVTAIHLLRVDKEFGSFTHHSWPVGVIESGWKAFLLQRELYELDAILKRAAA